MTLKGPGRKGVLTQKAMVLNWRLCRLMTQAPGKAGSLRKLGKGILPASLSRGAEKNAACITCPAARKRAPFVQDYLSGNRKVVHLFPLRSMLEAKAFYSPQLCWGGISLKHTIQKTLHSLKWLCSVFQMVRGARLELARCNHTPLKRARLPIPLPAQNAAPPLCCKRAVRGKAIPGLCCYVREGSCFTLLKRKFRL